MGDKILVTGVSGFVGRALAEALDKAGLEWIGQTRSPELLSDNRLFLADLTAYIDWTPYLKGVGTVVHLAGLAHVLKPGPEAKQLLYRINTEATKELAEQAAQSGVRRFIFAGSIHSTLFENKTPDANAYGHAKLLAEQEILRVVSNTATDPVILRPCLMLGAGAKGNLASMMRFLQHGLPLPFASIRNKRSMMYVRNFADLVLWCILSSKPLAGTYSCSDGVVYSTPDLFRKVAQALGVPARLIPFPVSVLRFAGKITGKEAMIEKLIGDLVVDGSPLCQKLGWQPKYSHDEGFREMAASWSGAS